MPTHCARLVQARSVRTSPAVNGRSGSSAASRAAFVAARARSVTGGSGREVSRCRRGAPAASAAADTGAASSRSIANGITGSSRYIGPSSSSAAVATCQTSHSTVRPVRTTDIMCHSVVGFHVAARSITCSTRSLQQARVLRPRRIRSRSRSAGDA